MLPTSGFKCAIYEGTLAESIKTDQLKLSKLGNNSLDFVTSMYCSAATLSG